ncbi:PleD family two-component system response regulator [Elusimicrobiota bacterium]
MKEHSDWKGRKILIVDDDHSYRTIMSIILRARGFEVREAARGDDAVQLAESDSPDLILLDILMPNISGFDTLRLLRKNKKTHRVPVVMVTARDLAKDSIRSFQSGADGFLQKPHDWESIKKAFGGLLDNGPEGGTERSRSARWRQERGGPTRA